MYFSASEWDAKIQGARRNEYKKLLSEIKPGLIVTADHDGTTRFIFAGGGLSAMGPGWLKGIEYIPGDYKKEGVLLPSLDKVDSFPEDVYLRKIEPHWFLVYQRDS